MPTQTTLSPALSREEVAAYLGVSTRTVINLQEKDPTFPAPRYVGRLPRWCPHRIQEWVAEGGSAPEEAPPVAPRRRGRGRIQ